MLAANESSAAARDGVRTNSVASGSALPMAAGRALRRAVISARPGEPEGGHRERGDERGRAVRRRVTAFLTIAFRAARGRREGGVRQGDGEGSTACERRASETRRDEENARGDDDDDFGDHHRGAHWTPTRTTKRRSYDAGDTDEGAAIAAATRRGVGLRRADSSLLGVPAPTSGRFRTSSRDAKVMLAGAFAFTTVRLIAQRRRANAQQQPSPRGGASARGCRERDLRRGELRGRK